MPTHKLTDAAVRKAKPGARPIRLFDGRGMYLEVRPNGAKYWRLKYRFAAKEKLLALGVYPEVSLRTHGKRAARPANSSRLGQIPVPARKAWRTAPTDVAADSFETIAREFLAIKVDERSRPHAARWIERLKADVFPWLGSQRLREVTPPMC